MFRLLLVLLLLLLSFPYSRLEIDKAFLVSPRNGFILMLINARSLRLSASGAVGVWGCRRVGATGCRRLTSGFGSRLRPPPPQLGIPDIFFIEILTG